MEGAGGVVTITAECDRFLYNMMRIISGTLVEVALVTAGLGPHIEHPRRGGAGPGFHWNPGPNPSAGHHH